MAWLFSPHLSSSPRPSATPHSSRITYAPDSTHRSRIRAPKSSPPHSPSNFRLNAFDPSIGSGYSAHWGIHRCRHKAHWSFRSNCALSFTLRFLLHQSYRPSYLKSSVSTPLQYRLESSQGSSIASCGPPTFPGSMAQFAVAPTAQESSELSVYKP